MSADLAVLGDLPVSRYGPEDPLQKEFSKGKSFLPRIEFKSGSAAICKSKKFPTDHYALVKGKELIDMGEIFAALFLSYRYKAIDFRTKGKIVVSYDPTSKEFKAMQAIADGPKGPAGELPGCMYGAEFLLAARMPDNTIELGTLLCGTSSWKMIVKKLFAFVTPVRKFGSFSSKLIEGKYTYMAPEVSTFSGSFTLDSIPSLTDEIQKFSAVSGVMEEDATDDDADATPPDGRVR